MNDSMQEGFYRKSDKKHHTDEELSHLSELEHKRQKKEFDLIDEEVEYLEEKQDETLWDLIVIYFGLSLIVLGIIVLVFEQFTFTTSVIGLIALGGITFTLGMAWKFILKYQFRKEEKKLKAEEKEIKEWDQI